MKNTILLVMLFALPVMLSARFQAQHRDLQLSKKTPPRVGQWPGKSKRFALLIGVNKYDDPPKVTLDLGRKQRPFAVIEGYRANDLVIARKGSTPQPPPLAPAPAVRMSVAGVPLAPLSFQTAETGPEGELVNRRREEGWGYAEDLGNGVKLELVEIPAGEFLMGSPENEVGRREDEGLPHRVSVKGFLMGRSEVTQRQWRAVALLPKVKIDLNPDPSYFKGDDLPVEQVSWDEVTEFMARLNARAGRGYRLPSEAEWEYAARAGTTTPFAFGATVAPEIINYRGTDPSRSGSKVSYRERTVIAGSLGIANSWGLFDMHGNVWEWCEDLWPGRDQNPTGGGAGRSNGGDSGRRVLRGGSWGAQAIGCRSALRDSYLQNGRNYTIGLRVVAR